MIFFVPKERISDVQEFLDDCPLKLDITYQPAFDEYVIGAPRNVDWVALRLVFSELECYA